MRHRERVTGFVEEIWKWYAVHKRVLPWRDIVAPAEERAYCVLVSEVMLQQTQVERVRIFYPRFLRVFPMLQHLAQATSAEVIRAWRGMGYNSRALRLRDAAREIVTRHGGAFPRDFGSLVAIKGVGSYTAAAILNFAFNIPTPCLDTNIRRILHRTFVGPENPDGTWRKDDGYLLGLAGEVLEAAFTPSPPTPLPMGEGKRGEGVSHDTRNWHAALMDFGSLVQAKRNPKWEECPLTARGLMRATEGNLKQATRVASHREPGRMVGSRYVPNRIFRGRVIEALRDEPRGLVLGEIGERICTDWSVRLHERWLRGILDSLKRDALIAERPRGFVLAE